MPRVILYLNSFPKLSETFIVNKFLGLLKKGWDVHVVCMESTPIEWRNFPKLTQYPNIRKRLHVSWFHRPRWLAALLIPILLLRCMLQVPRLTYHYLFKGGKMFGLDILRRLYLDAEILLAQPDIIHFEFGTLASERMYLKELLDCKIVVSYRGYDLNFTGLNNPNFYDSVWEKADMLHFLGNHLWQVARERGCPVDKPYMLIPPAVDTAYFQRSSKDQNLSLNPPLRILSVGRLEWKKGYEYALQAVKILIDRGVPCEYHLIGDGLYQEALYFARYQLGLENMTKFIGAQSSDAVKAEMDWADIFLHPSLSEGFCNVVLEAQSMEIPVIASYVGGLKENIEENVTGFFAPLRNPRLLAEKIEILARDPKLRKKMGTAGRDRILQHFQPDAQILCFEKIYLQILDTK